MLLLVLILLLPIIIRVPSHISHNFFFVFLLFVSDVCFMCLCTYHFIHLFLCLTTYHLVWVILTLVKNNIFSGLVCFLHSSTLRLLVEMNAWNINIRKTRIRRFISNFTVSITDYISLWNTCSLSPSVKKAFTIQLKQCVSGQCTSVFKHP